MSSTFTMSTSHRPSGWSLARILSSGLSLALVACLLLSSKTQARSAPSPALKRLHEPRAVSLQILPRTPVSVSKRSLHVPPISPPSPDSLLATDQLRLTLDLPILDHPIHLHLKPTEHLFHPEATYTTFTADGEELLAPLLKDDHKVYTGHVIHPDHSARYWALSRLNVFRDEREKQAGQLGTAKIMIHHPGSTTEGTDPVFEGVFEVNGMTYHVLTKDHYSRVRTPQDIDVEEIAVGESQMVIFRDSDHDETAAPAEHSTCSHDAHPFNANSSHPVWSNAAAEPGHDDDADWLQWMSAMDPMRNFKRDDIQTGGGAMGNAGNFVNSIGNDAGCPNEQRVVYMGVAADCNYVQTYGGADQARTQILNDWNSISALYRSTFNISLGIISLIVQNETCPTNAPSDAPWNFACTDSVTLDQRLSIFSQWRGSRGDDGAGLWHLMSACATDSEVGVAWLGTLCTTSATQQSGSFVSGTGVSTAQRMEWSLVSHEIGHGFGAIHDCTSGCSLSSACCPLSAGSCSAGGQYIMNPTTNSNEVAFSPCSLGNICSNLNTRSVGTSCIQAPGSQTIISLQQCGNGIVEAGEDCDPGSGASSPCCDSATCKFTQGSICDPSSSGCCTTSCQLASNGTVCRPSIDSTCDIEEFCTGTNSSCPEDRTADDGTGCGSGLSCASGQCTSLNRQCQSVGASLNLQTSCSQRADTSCVVTCQDPSNGGQCLILQTPLIDGSSCGYGGRCYNQTCEAGSTTSVVSSWYRQNLQISIPVTIVAGIIILVILFMLLRCIFCGCGPRKKKQGGIAPVARRHRGRGRGRGQHNAPPPPMSQYAGGSLPTPPSHPGNRNTDSVASVAPLTQNMAPTPYPGQYNERQSWHNGGGPPPGGYAPPPPPQRHSAGAGNWVDPSSFNGPDYNYQQEQQQYGHYR